MAAFSIPSSENEGGNWFVSSCDFMQQPPAENTNMLLLFVQMKHCSLSQQELCVTL